MYGPGRFGHPTRLSGVQHPAPPLKCLVDRKPAGILVTAQYAQAAFGGRNVTCKPPKTEIWCMLYAQVKQADARAEPATSCWPRPRSSMCAPKHRDVASFLAVRSDMPPQLANSMNVALDLLATGKAQWSADEILQLLDQFNLSRTTGLSVLAVEMMPRYDQYILFSGQAADTAVYPLSRQLGQYRILRTSPLVAAPEIC